jgi:uncharacterized membrane protein YphA (DoxX/SURF4 family)
MRRIRGKFLHTLFLGTLLAVVWLVSPENVAAHEKWFVDDPKKYPVDFSLFFSWQVFAAVLIGAVALAVALVIDQRYRVWRRAKNPKLENRLAGIEEKRLRRVYSFLPLLLAIHTAVPLLVSGFQLQLFSPNLKMQQNLLSGVLALAEVLIALALVYGVFTNFAALGLIGLFVAGLVLSPFIGIEALLMLEHANFVGIALFFLIIGRGPFSGDNLLGRQFQPNPNYVQYAIPVLRWSLGISLSVLAFTEKLLNPVLAEAFLQQKINFNLGQAFGINNETFIFMAGIVEFVFGVLLISGAVPRLVIVIAWIPFNLTLPYLGWVELAGHLPIYAVMLILLLVEPTSHRAAKKSAAILAEEAGAIPAATRLK